MVALPRPIVTRVLPMAGAAAAAAFVALACVALPATLLARCVEASGIAALVPAAAPPLGVTARGVLALGGGLLAAAIAWAVLYLLFGTGGVFGARENGAPTVRRADAHPDAPPRRPLSAAELADVPASLGRANLAVPTLPVPIAGPFDRLLPADLDTPLAALDPAAIPVAPRAAPRAVPPLAPGERMRTFALAPAPPPLRPAPSEPPSIEALLRRLEAGAERRVPGAR
ncbi:hypothetical protein [uncultured Sphingomonas sp.]|uniref:hypothetical protein n=1 Tax=uncultured Sphingomonas sp. TaxID=158754 RepID=UPI0035CB7E10